MTELRASILLAVHLLMCWVPTMKVQALRTDALACRCCFGGVGCSRGEGGYGVQEQLRSLLEVSGSKPEEGFVHLEPIFSLPVSTISN